MPRWWPNWVSASSVSADDVADHAADAARRREQRRGLALDRGEVRLLGAVDVEEVLELEHLTAAQLADRRGEQRRRRRRRATPRAPTPARAGSRRRGSRRCCDQRAFTLGTPRRVSASSITSSWYSEPRCTSSTDAPPVTASSRGRRAAPRGARRPAHSVRVGRRRLPPGCEQVAGDVAEEPVVGPDRRARSAPRPGAGLRQRREPRSRRVSRRTPRHRGATATAVPGTERRLGAVRERPGPRSRQTLGASATRGDSPEPAAADETGRWSARASGRASD